MNIHYQYWHTPRYCVSKMDYIKKKQAIKWIRIENEIAVCSGKIICQMKTQMIELKANIFFVRVTPLSLYVCVCVKSFVLDIKWEVYSRQHHTLSFVDMSHSHIYLLIWPDVCQSVLSGLHTFSSQPPEEGQPILHHTVSPKQLILSSDTLTEFFFKCVEAWEKTGCRA